MSDLISRQAAIDVTWEEPTYTDTLNVLTEVRDKIRALPSAQPEERTDKRTETHACDCISRQAAIDALMAWEEESIWDEECLKHRGEPFWTAPSDVVEQLPSAQPETAKRIVGKSRDGMTLWYQCDMCNEPVDEQDNYCRGCGRRLIDG